LDKLKWLLFDFGGCLDSDGLHSRTLFYRQFKNAGLLSESISTSDFQEAYSVIDRLMTDHSLILNSPLNIMNEKMCILIARYLSIPPTDKILQTATAITEFQEVYLNRNHHILGKLRESYQLGIISNFSGNLEIILKQYSLLHFFNFVIDSYHAGFSKPDQNIFSLALAKCDTAPEHICFIGDNIDRDIKPAQKAGMKTILISSGNQENSADLTLGSLTELLLLTQRVYPTAIQNISTKR
jgi:putative hydrolase of the HAD superfamily